MLFLNGADLFHAMVEAEEKNISRPIFFYNNVNKLKDRGHDLYSQVKIVISSNIYRINSNYQKPLMTLTFNHFCNKCTSSEILAVFEGSGAEDFLMFLMNEYKNR